MFIESTEASGSIQFSSMNEWANIETAMRKYVEENFLRRCDNGIYIVDYDMISTRDNLKPDTRVIGNTCQSSVDFFFHIRGVAIATGTLLFGMKVDIVKNGMILSSGEVRHGDYVIKIIALVEQRHFPVPVNVGQLIDLRVTSCRYNPKDRAVKVNTDSMKSRPNLSYTLFYLNPAELTDRMWNGLDAAFKYADHIDESGVKFKSFVDSCVKPHIPAYTHTIAIRKRSDFAALPPGFYYHVQTTVKTLTLGKLKVAMKKNMTTAASEMMGLCMAHAQFIYSCQTMA